MSHAWSLLSEKEVRFALKRGPFCPGCGLFCLWSILSMVHMSLIQTNLPKSMKEDSGSNIISMGSVVQVTRNTGIFSSFMTYNSHSIPIFKANY